MPDETNLVVRKKTRAPKGVIELPEISPPPPEWEEDEGPGPARREPSAEVLSKAEQRYRESNEQTPPEVVITSAPMTKNSLVTPIEVEAKTLWGFLEALECITVEKSEYPILAGVKMRFIPGDEPRLLVEANNKKVWAAASLKAWGGNEEFAAVLPLQRAISVIKRLASKYSTITVGLDRERIHVGNFSFPFFGKVEHFPKKPRLEDHLVSVTWSTLYATQILERVLPAVDESDASYDRNLCGVFIDLESRAAVATNGKRMHVLELPLMKVEIDKRWKDAPTGVRLPLDVYRYIQAVEDRDWTGFRLGDTKVMIGSEDFGLVCNRLEGSFPDWSKAVTEWPGQWVVDRDVFLSAVKEASLLLLGKDEPGICLGFDLRAGSIAIVSSSVEGGRFERILKAKPSGKLLSFVTVTINPVFLLDAVDACRGSSLRIGVARENDQVTFRGDDNCFVAAIASMRR